MRSNLEFFFCFGKFGEKGELISDEKLVIQKKLIEWLVINYQSQDNEGGSFFRVQEKL